MAIGVLIKRVAKRGDNAKVLLPHIIELFYIRTGITYPPVPIF